jgi:hypothetical protein
VNGEFRAATNPTGLRPPFGLGQCLANRAPAEDGDDDQDLGAENDAEAAASCAGLTAVAATDGRN